MASKTAAPANEYSAAAAARKEGVTVTDVDATNMDHTGSADDSDDALDAQAGVQGIEATTSVWTKAALIFAYVWIWIVYFVDTTQQGATSSLTPYVTSAFQQHSLTPTVSILSSIIGGVSKLTIAKMLDVIGRPAGYMLCIILTTLGLVLMAACDSVEMYAAAQVFYWVGYNGLTFCLSIFIADTSSLRNRGLMFAYANSPYIITTWLSGPISEAILDGPGWRWGFGIFTIVTPVATLPLWVLFVHYARVARAQGLLANTPSGRNAWQSFVHYAREFDAVGLLLISAGLSLFLLAFNLEPRQSEGWSSALVLCFIIIGIALIVVFAVWEKWFAPVTFIPYGLLVDRTVLGSCVLAGSLFVSFYMWNSYFFSFLQVVNGLSVTKASYVTQIYNVGSCLFSIPTGLVIRYTNRFKGVALYFGLPISILGGALLIHFRQPSVDIGYIVMCQIFIAFGGGALVIAQQVSIMAATGHQYIAVVLAIENMCSSIGGAIGSTVSSAIWQAKFPAALAKNLPESAQANLAIIYGDLTTQLSYPAGSETRIAIQDSYGEAVRYMYISATCIKVISVVAVLFWRNISLKDKKQVKGIVF
ncbi:Fungal trichothecene efflux pump (TRI12) [Geosmithia morbida]|uniref:Fungal trichothecene efflux pump (TRI12) n=1 Tax=Geosmithia morbida TaxID=1094350 RepID=A0A9P4YR79_9HYPO|nr:Fungal trichothecene efflux pump (TRI12) [Geosmithia morbida]KAF4121628.1 Fungal trichothecene efflux pump (TRI12) [Geosmithia morbida]